MSDKPNTMTRRDEAETLLPFYLNGTLSGDELQLVEDWLANDPSADEALLAAEAELALISEANDAFRPGADAFRRFSAALDKEPTRKASAGSRLSAFLARTFAVPAPLAFAAAAAILALVVVGVNQSGPKVANDIEVAGADASAVMPFLLVTFADDAALSGIAALVSGNGGTIADGPIGGTTFKIALEGATAADYDKAAAAFAASPLVSKVMPGRKPDAAP